MRPLFVLVVCLFAGVPVSLVGQPATGSPGAWLGELNVPQAEERIAKAPLVVVPFGAGAKEHGPHLPMNADLVVAEYLCQKAIEKLPIVVAPTIAHGWFPAFRDFPGTEIEDAAVFEQLVFDVARSLVESGAQRVVLLNTGIARATGLPMAIAGRELRSQLGVPVLVLSWDDLEDARSDALLEQVNGGHADEGETSIHLFLQPDLVSEPLPRAAPQRERGPTGPGYRPGLISRDPRDPDYLPEGYTGDPSLATAEKGKRLLEIMVERFLAALEAFSNSPLPGG